jgi:hypothetical protein
LLTAHLGKFEQSACPICAAKSWASSESQPGSGPAFPTPSTSESQPGSGPAFPTPGSGPAFPTPSTSESQPGSGPALPPGSGPALPLLSALGVLPRVCAAAPVACRRKQTKTTRKQESPGSMRIVRGVHHVARCTHLSGEAVGPELGALSLRARATAAAAGVVSEMATWQDRPHLTDGPPRACRVARGGLAEHARSSPSDVAACRYQQLELRDHRPHLTEWRRHEVDYERCGPSTRTPTDDLTRLADVGRKWRRRRRSPRQPVEIVVHRSWNAMCPLGRSDLHSMVARESATAR